MYISAPRHNNPMCVVCSVTATGEISSQQMTRAHFDLASADLPFGDDILSVENVLCK